ncbi:MAG: hypothetical protein ACI9CQ_002812, partial [Saprospiraceae bacterium]
MQLYFPDVQISYFEVFIQIVQPLSLSRERVCQAIANT